MEFDIDIQRAKYLMKEIECKRKQLLKKYSRPAVYDTKSPRKYARNTSLFECCDVSKVSRQPSISDISKSLTIIYGTTNNSHDHKYLSNYEANIPKKRKDKCILEPLHSAVPVKFPQYTKPHYMSRKMNRLIEEKKLEVELNSIRYTKIERPSAVSICNRHIASQVDIDPVRYIRQQCEKKGFEFPMLITRNELSSSNTSYIETVASNQFVTVSPRKSSINKIPFQNITTESPERIDEQNEKNALKLRAKSSPTKSPTRLSQGQQKLDFVREDNENFSDDFQSHKHYDIIEDKKLESQLENIDQFIKKQQDKIQTAVMHYKIQRNIPFVDERKMDLKIRTLEVSPPKYSSTRIMGTKQVRT
jgi:hypothetical protein